MATKEDFRKYLDETGVLDSIDKVLISLYEEKEQPADPLSYIKQYLGAPKGVDAAKIKEENESLEKEIMDLENKIKAAKGQK